MKKVGDWMLPDADSHFAEEIRRTGTFQIERLHAALVHVRERALAVDGGAHVGIWTRTLCDNFGFVHAFEPAKDTFECLQRNLWARVRLGECALHNKALGRATARASVTIDEKYARQGNTGARYIRVEPDGDVEVVALDDMGLEGVGFVKLDIEGAEPLAIEGAAETLQRWRPVVYVECKKGFARRFGYPDDAALRMLQRMGATEVLRIKADHVFAWRDVK